MVCALDSLLEFGNNKPFWIILIDVFDSFVSNFSVGSSRSSLPTNLVDLFKGTCAVILLFGKIDLRQYHHSSL